MSALLTVSDVADRVGLSTKAVRRAIERGDLAASKLCGRIRVRREDLDRWIDENRIGATAPRIFPPTPLAGPAADGLRALLDDGRTTS
jgi:excisionase family DNA binding protein